MSPSSRRLPPARRPPAPRRSPRPAARPPAGRGPLPAPQGRPELVPFAAAFGLLVAAEDLYLGYLLWEPDRRWHWYVGIPVLLAAWAVAGAVLVQRGARRAWPVLAAAAVPPLLALAGLVLLFAALGDGRAAGWAALLLAGPVGCLVLATRRPVREWTRPGRAARPAGRDRDGTRAR
ncbi:hypothetical protein GCU56_11705 [Geodermatophilus sabuli]|uniref:Uncharacterized protein n=1 Tax=Geodermatophilus sabuli TaxID=1564158 RepID=A0A7K3W2X1_9ACTN|nr:hypothetical protein [Geodermatophilus sabuli]NEK58534.1 hypothetical protein [Geodermatophilus sabuli]